jgi:hypothetical protein
MGRRSRNSQSSVEETPVLEQNQDELQEKLNQIEEEYKEAAEEKPKRRRSKRKEIEEEQIKQTTEGFVLIGNTFIDFIVPRLPNPIPVSDSERELWNKTFSAVAEKYAAYVSRFGAEISFVIASIMIFAPRMQKNERKNNTNIRQDGNGQDNIGEGVNKE